jgi:hypothetical protein
MFQDSNQRIQKGDAVVRRDVEDVGLQELEHYHTQLLVTAIAQLSKQPQPALVLELRPRRSLHHVQQFLGDEAPEGAEGLLSNIERIVFSSFGG